MCHQQGAVAAATVLQRRAAPNTLYYPPERILKPQQGRCRPAWVCPVVGLDG